MCMEDIKIGRGLDATIYQRTIPAGTPTLIAGKDPKRVRISLSGDGSGKLFVGTESVPPASTSGLQASPNASLFTLRVEDIGPVIQEAIFVFVVGVTQIVTVVDCSLQRMD